MLLFEILFLVLLGFFVGVVASMTGIGGGTLIVPALSILYEFTSQQAVGTSLAVIIFTSVGSTYAYSRQKRIDYKVGAVSTVTTMPGAVLGAYLTSFISSSLLGTIFSVFLMFLALCMLFNRPISFPKIFMNIGSLKRRLVDSNNNVFEYEANISSTFVLSFFGGISSGLLGIGGGALIVPILNIAAGLPIHISVATSMFIMIFTSLAGVATHFQLNNVKFEHSVYIAIGAVIGAQVGARVAKKVSAKFLTIFFGLVLMIVSVRLLVKFI